MAQDPALTQRTRHLLAGDPAVTEKRMFGGIAFLWKGHMVVAVSERRLMVRVGSDLHQDSLEREHVRPMDFTGRPMKGYVYVDASGLESDTQLRFWLDRGRAFVAALPPKKAK